MAYDYSNLVEKTQHWAEQACTAGWLNADNAVALQHFDTRSPEALFSGSTLAMQAGTRPLIVAFMGGTGVGKSSLLNRLAGQAIAKAGIERPTSREVTLFHHRNIAIQNFPEQLPLATIRVAQHDDETKKNIVWIDMPDFDSTEHSNKALVLQWLPHIDVLVYVVSPERYRDEKAWRLLLAEGARHAWLFVLNQWDRGQDEQYADFNQQLHKAGFAAPIIFKTVCTEGPKDDEFAALETTILSLATGHIIDQLEQRGVQVRKDELQKKLQNTAKLLGSWQTFQQVPALWQQQWRETVKLLQQGFAWPMKQMATYYAQHAADLMKNPPTQQNSLWDAWAQARFDDALDEFIGKIDEQGLPVLPFKQQIIAVREKAPKIMQTQTELAARQALANPGNALQRVFLKGMRFAEIFLPLLAMTWVGYKVFMGYYTSNMAENHYLGVDFAIHSSLLIAMTWLIPYFILKKLQPSLQKSALKGLNKGLLNAFSVIETEVLQVVDMLVEQHKDQITKLAKIMEQCAATDGEQKVVVDSDSPLTRMLMK
ncbi:GTPase [Methylobacter psychrophilus]|uniref:GTPase n=1 Tax=Methylobacter psychrophilus TaxID=96941 RepID=UPI0021D4F809|nr:GTPase [Methylobacter psychrophilus]